MPILENSIEQDENEEATQSEKNNKLDELPARNKNDDRQNDFNR